MPVLNLDALAEVAARNGSLRHSRDRHRYAVINVNRACCLDGAQKDFVRCSSGACAPRCGRPARYEHLSRLAILAIDPPAWIQSCIPIDPLPGLRRLGHALPLHRRRTRFSSTRTRRREKVRTIRSCCAARSCPTVTRKVATALMPALVDRVTALIRG